MARNALIQIRRDTAANWTSVNPTLAAGEMGFETDTGKVKIGDGSTAWASLLYVADASAIDASDITGTTLASNVVSSSLTSVGTITTGTWSGSFGAVSGANLTSLNASNLGSGTVPSARISGSYTGITGVGTLTSLTVGGAGANRSITINAPSSYYAIQYFQINGVNKWHYEVDPSGTSWSLVESGVSARLTMTNTTLTVNGGITASSNIGWSASTYLVPVSGATNQYGSIKVTGTPTSSGWSGYSINGDAVFMSQSSYYGLYDNSNFEWGILCARNAETSLYYNGAEKFRTSNIGVSITGDINTEASPIGTIFASSWFRSTGASGWYNQTYGGGIWMNDTTWVQVYGSRRFLAGSGLNVGGTTNNSTLNVIGGTAWFSAMSAGGGSTVVNNFGFLQYVSSRRELKENIVDVTQSSALGRVLGLRPVEFTMKPEYVMNSNELTQFDIKRGFIAQEVVDVDHWYGQWGWVDENQMMVTDSAIQGELELGDSTPIYWNHDAVIADLVACIHNLNARLAVLESN